MPNRIIKESICRSDNLDLLTAEEERFFYRLMVQCDDFGRYDGRPAIIKGSCFPLKQRITPAKVSKMLEALCAADLVFVYHVETLSYIQMLTWGEHQKVRNQRSKYPAPPRDIGAPIEHQLPSEKDIEDLIYHHLSECKTFNGEQLLSVDRQVRTGESYLDIVARGDSTYIFELKRSRLSNKSMLQILSYLEKCPGNGLLVGSGLASNFEVSNSEVAIIVYDEDTLALTTINRPAWLNPIVTLFSVKQREITNNNSDAVLAPNPIQSNPNPILIQSESNITPDETYRSTKGKILKGKVLERFEAFLTAFGSRAGIADAADSWFKIKPMPDELYTEIIAGAKRYSIFRASLKKGDTPKMAQGWLTSRRWEDEHVPSGNGARGRESDRLEMAHDPSVYDRGTAREES